MNLTEDFRSVGNICNNCKIEIKVTESAGYVLQNLLQKLLQKRLRSPKGQNVTNVVTVTGFSFSHTPVSTIN
jgi:hypothetical protein